MHREREVCFALAGRATQGTRPAGGAGAQDRWPSRRGAPRIERMRALIFDLDGTLVDTVYAHVFAWQTALSEAGMPIDRCVVSRAKPEPDLFLACQERLAVTPEECYAVGDSVWDLLAARRARMLGIGVLTGGYGQA